MPERPFPLPEFPGDPNPDHPGSTAPLSTPQPSSEATPGGEMGHSETHRDIAGAETISERQLQAIELTMLGYSDVHIAETLRINRRTLFRWRNLDDDFRRVLNNARIQMYASAADRYQTLLARATGIMSQCLQDPADENRFRAATLVLSMAGCFRPLPPKFFPTRDKALPERKPKPKRWPEPQLPYKCG